MRIMVLASGDLWAGAEVVIYQLVCGLVTVQEIDLCVVILNDERLAQEIKKLGVDVHIIDESNHSFPAILLAVRRLVSLFSPDVIHSHRYQRELTCLACDKS